MKSFFAAIILPFVALALGDESGDSKANATQLDLLTNVESDGIEYSLTLLHYNTYDYDEEMYVFNGLLVLTTQEEAEPNFDVGFCMQMDASNDQKWDCYTNKFTVPSADGC